LALSSDPAVRRHLRFEPAYKSLYGSQVCPCPREISLRGGLPVIVYNIQTRTSFLSLQTFLSFRPFFFIKRLKLLLSKHLQRHNFSVFAIRMYASAPHLHRIQPANRPNCAGYLVHYAYPDVHPFRIPSAARLSCVGVLWRISRKISRFRIISRSWAVCFDAWHRRRCRDEPFASHTSGGDGTVPRALWSRYCCNITNQRAGGLQAEVCVR